MSVGDLDYPVYDMSTFSEKDYDITGLQGIETTLLTVEFFTGIEGPFHAVSSAERDGIFF